jgi:hypothetical protein
MLPSDATLLSLISVVKRSSLHSVAVMLHEPELCRNLDSYSRADLLQESVMGSCKDVSSHTRESLQLYVQHASKHWSRCCTIAVKLAIVEITRRTFLYFCKLESDNNQLEKQVQIV